MDSWEAILLVIATIGSVAAAAGAWLQDRRSSAAQLASVQRKLDLMMNHLGIAAPEDPVVLRHLADGRRVEAVRAYREQTGASLLEAKQAVDRLAEGQFPPPARDSSRPTP
jgi:ribosomal protein L7/L12